ncbi:MAG TPA: HigA family addiction module antitoxin [Terriglobales bacterium]|nr:HigA family addiction module antitoxin [Terriglobales bacterium]
MAYPRRGAAGWAVHPGEILREEFLRPLNMSVYALAKSLHVPAPRINDVVLEKRRITPDTALRLARFFGTSEEFWMNLQDAFDLAMAKKQVANELNRIKPLQAAGD